jgi:hypothetical protein
VSGNAECAFPMSGQEVSPGAVGESNLRSGQRAAMGRSAGRDPPFWDRGPPTVASVDPAERDGEASGDGVTRFFFVLPEPLPVPPPGLIAGQVGDTLGEHRRDDPWVLLRLHQTTAVGRTNGAMAALSDVFDRAVPAVESGGQGGATATRDIPMASYTVVEAFTGWASPDDPPADWNHRACDLAPRADSFMRCLRLVDVLVRAYRVAVDAPQGRPSYPRIAPMVLVMLAPGPMPDLAVDDEPGDLAGVAELMNRAWSGPNLMLLEHLNLDPVVWRDVDDEVLGQTMRWLEALQDDSPFVTWRERRLEAVRARTVDGDYAVALNAAHTAGEVFVDGFLALLLWDEGADPAEAARVLERGGVVTRCRVDLAARLRGNWHTPIDAWVRDCVKPRGRVVHAGFEPTRRQAEDALTAVAALEAHAFDRLAARRNEYMRPALMTLGVEGLERRQLYRGRIKRFHTGPALREPTWTDTFRLWRSQVIEIRLGTQTSAPATPRAGGDA